MRELQFPYVQRNEPGKCEGLGKAEEAPEFRIRHGSRRIKDETLSVYD